MFGCAGAGADKSVLGRIKTIPTMWALDAIFMQL
jgi:hypothetical protein